MAILLGNLGHLAIHRMLRWSTRICRMRRRRRTEYRLRIRLVRSRMRRLDNLHWSRITLLLEICRRTRLLGA